MQYSDASRPVLHKYLVICRAFGGVGGGVDSLDCLLSDFWGFSVDIRGVCSLFCMKIVRI